MILRDHCQKRRQLCIDCFTFTHSPHSTGHSCLTLLSAFDITCAWSPDSNPEISNQSERKGQRQEKFQIVVPLSPCTANLPTSNCQRVNQVCLSIDNSRGFSTRYITHWFFFLSITLIYSKIDWLHSIHCTFLATLRESNGWYHWDWKWFLHYTYTYTYTWTPNVISQWQRRISA